MLRRSFSLSLALLLLAPETYAKQCRGVSMPERLSIDGKDLVLNGMGLREATLLNIDVYVAGLYLEQRSSDAKKILASDKPKHVLLALVRDVAREDMAEQLHKYFRYAAGGDYEALKARFERLISWLPSLRAGETFSVSYRPGHGLQVKHGKRTLGTIPGADFSRAIFAIWLGDKPPNEGLKAGRAVEQP
jgi:hypothetical protein